MRLRSQRAVVFLALIALVGAATVGCAWHHHTTQLAASTCQICHLGHVSLHPTAHVAATRPAPLVVPETAADEPCALLDLSFPHDSPRAPPLSS